MGQTGTMNTMQILHGQQFLSLTLLVVSVGLFTIWIFENGTASILLILDIVVCCRVLESVVIQKK